MLAYDLFDVTTPSNVVEDVGVEPLIFVEEIVAEFFGVAVNVHSAVDLYRIKTEESPVRATVVELVSTTVPETLGAQLSEDAVAVIVHVLLPRDVLPLYVVIVSVHFPDVALGIWA